MDHTYERVELSVDVGLHKGWPYPLQLTVAYEVGADGLTVTHTATNKGATSSPFGLGMHTFIRAGDFPLDECALHLAAGTRLPIDPARMLPNAYSQAVAGTDYDFRTPRLLAGGAVGHSVQRIGRRRRQWSHATRAAGSGWNGHCPVTNREFPWIQAFVADPANDKGYPDRGRALALEPMTCPPDAFNSGIDLLVLHPGQTWTGSWGHQGAVIRLSYRGIV